MKFEDEATMKQRRLIEQMEREFEEFFLLENGRERECEKSTESLRGPVKRAAKNNIGSMKWGFFNSRGISVSSPLRRPH